MGEALCVLVGGTKVVNKAGVLLEPGCDAGIVDSAVEVGGVLAAVDVIEVAHHHVEMVAIRKISMFCVENGFL